MEINLRSANTEKQFSQIEKLYIESFPIEERKPFSLIIEKSKEGSVDILSIETDENHIMGEAIVAKYRDIALLDYFAIFPQSRNSGIGSHALKLLQSQYRNYRFILEIESTLYPVPNLGQRLRRKDFYLRNDMGYMGYSASLFGIEMELMANGTPVAFEEYHALYENVWGRSISGQIKLI